MIRTRSRLWVWLSVAAAVAVAIASMLALSPAGPEGGAQTSSRQDSAATTTPLPESASKDGTSDELAPLEAPPKPADPDVFLPPGIASRVIMEVPSATANSMSAFGQPDLALAYDELAERAAAGDLAAAQSLGSGLEVCGSHFRDLKRIEGAMQPTRLLATEEEREASVLQAEIEMADPGFVQRSKNCEGVTEAQTEEAGRWYEMGALRGDFRSADAYVNYFQPRLAELATNPAELQQFRSNASRFMHDGARQCIPIAFMRLSDAYANGYFEARDPVRAVAYRAVFQWTLGEAPRTGSLLGRLPPLSAHQISQAQDLANRIFDRSCR